MKKQWYYVVILGALALIFFLMLPQKSGENLYDSVIRIHVLANSDSAEDQANKLLVRDAILDFAKNRLDAFSDKCEAEEAIGASLDVIESIAHETLNQNGCDMPVLATLTEENYPTRDYDNLSLPQGKYLSLQVKIGNAQGKNWWCVLFPPICQNSACDAEEALLEAGMDEENVKTVTIKEGKYRIRFKILEWWGKAREKIETNF